MKRLSWLLLAIIMALSTAGFAPLESPKGPFSSTISSPPAGADLGSMAGSIPGYNIVCHNVRATRLCASVSERRVTPGSYVTIYGSMKTRGVGVPGQVMNVVWASNVTATCIGVTDATGLASCSTYVPANTPRARAGACQGPDRQVQGGYGLHDAPPIGRTGLAVLRGIRQHRQSITGGFVAALARSERGAPSRPPFLHPGVTCASSRVRGRLRCRKETPPDGGVLITEIVVPHGPSRGECPVYGKVGLKKVGGL